MRWQPMGAGLMVLAGLGSCIIPSLPILPQGEPFPMVIAFLLYYVATIKLAYISIFP